MLLRSLFLSLLLLLPALWSEAATPVPVRKGEHPGYSRLVLDFALVPDYRFDREGSTLRLTLEGDYTVDFNELNGDPLDHLRAAAVAREENRTVIAFNIPGAGVHRSFLSGSSIVIDVLADPTVVEPSPGPASTAPPAAAAERQQAEPVEAAPQRAEISPENAIPGGVPVALLRDGEATELRYGWRVSTPAAVFYRAGYLWVLFERGLPLDHSAVTQALQTNGAGAIKGVFPFQDPDHTIVRYRMERPGAVTVARVGNEWRVHMGPLAVAPKLVLAPERRDSSEGAILFVGADQVGGRIQVTDPEVGDQLDIMTLGDDGRGLASDRLTVDVELLASAQGVVVRPLSSDLRIARVARGVSIGSKDGLKLSASLLEGRMEAGASPFFGLINLTAWQRGPAEDFVKIEQEMLLKLSRATPAERKAVRWDLARFYLGHRFAPEGHAMLTLLAATDPQLSETAQWRAASGVALLGLGRYNESLKALLFSAMDEEAEIWLWRALAAERAGRNADALSYFRRGSEALAQQEAPFLARFHLAMARAALDEGNLDMAAGQIGTLRNMELDALSGLEADYLSGVVSERRGDLASARVRYQDAATSRDRELSTRARLALTRLEYREGDVSLEEAIASLERLRFAWRGDSLELDVLETLAGYYVSAKRHRLALETLQMAMAAFTNTPKARELAANMSGIFTDLFLNGAADQMSPVAALGLFYDFSELTPLGAEGDRMIRRLVERLVSVDLLDRAAGLLEHQLTYRLEGTAQADVAEQLGKIFLLDGKPEETLRILRMTRLPGLPNDIIAVRNLVEARALAELGRHEEAEVLIEDDRSRAAEELRSDIYWKSQNWRALAAVTGRLLGERWTNEEPLGLEERDILIREALAFSFLDNRAQLSTLRTRYSPLMRDGDYAGIFNLLTSADGLPRGELPRILGELGGVDRFRSFLAAYRAEFTDPAIAGGSGS